MDITEIHEKLDRIESLLLGTKQVLTFDEASTYTGISRSYLYKLTSAGIVPHSKPNGKLIFFDINRLNEWLIQNNRKSKSEIKDEALSYVLRKG
ncbi:helix-turn-helix transcriptional regulator [Luteirhabdus pelagi]|uniref:helix-turn-helix transcriptional regulator n=1 Tax=Luteirhabdus pelagi TaxID=2792783 RepID=UPI001939526F|nr:helix-turn-helix domain-containing protein [Luteirhabdus pelagi]